MGRHDVEAAKSLWTERGQVDRDSGALSSNSLGPTHDYRPEKPFYPQPVGSVLHPGNMRVMI